MSANTLFAGYLSNYFGIEVAFLALATVAALAFGSSLVACRRWIAAFISDADQPATNEWQAHQFQGRNLSNWLTGWPLARPGRHSAADRCS